MRPDTRRTLIHSWRGMCKMNFEKGKQMTLMVLFCLKRMQKYVDEDCLRNEYTTEIFEDETSLGVFER